MVVQLIREFIRRGAALDLVDSTGQSVHARVNTAWPLWVPDAEAPMCMANGCAHAANGTQFGVFLRRHHCRRCGLAVCDGCSSRRLALARWLSTEPPHKLRAQSARVAGAKPVRVCDGCYKCATAATMEPQQRPMHRHPKTETETENENELSLWRNLGGAVACVGSHMSCANRQEGPTVTLGDDSTDAQIGGLVRTKLCDALLPFLNFGFKASKLFGKKYHFWDYLEKLLDDQLEKSSDGSFSVEKQSARYNLCRAVAIIADIKLMERDNDMRLRAFICYGLNVQSLHRWMQVLRQNEMLPELATGFFEPWSFVRSERSMARLSEVLRPLQGHTFRLALDFEFASVNAR